jgi:hypothetical protein
LVRYSSAAAAEEEARAKLQQRNEKAHFFSRIDRTGPRMNMRHTVTPIDVPLTCMYDYTELRAEDR